MNKFLTLRFGVVMMVALAAQASSPAPDSLARIHFAGAGQISADTNTVAFAKLWCSPEALALRDQTLNKLARAPYGWLKAKMPPGAGDEAARLRPLLDDLSGSEWFLQIRDTTNGSPEYALAIRLDAGRAQLWQTNLENVLESWTMMPVGKIQNGWELKKHLPPDLVRFVRVGDWVVFGLGQNELPSNDEMVRRILAEKRPAPLEKNSWLTADLDWPRLARWFPELNPLDLPETRLELAGRDGTLHWDGQLIFPQPLALVLDPWRVPTNIIYQPFIGFTAVRGIAPWLEKQNRAQPYEISPVPNQVFVWALAGMPFQTYAAAPVPNATNILGQLFQKLSAHTNWQGAFEMPLAMTMTNRQISWRGLPFLAPDLQALHEPSGDFLFAGGFPNDGLIRPLPPELLAQLARTNLIYYDWENTGERLKLLPQLVQLALMITRHQQLEGESAAGKWLAGIGPTLSNTVTEVTQTAPNELGFKRSAPGGFTAIELTALANWLEAPNFPGCDLSLPSLMHHRHHPQTTNAPPARTSAVP